MGLAWKQQTLISLRKYWFSEAGASESIDFLKEIVVWAKKCVCSFVLKRFGLHTYVFSFVCFNVWPSQILVFL